MKSLLLFGATGGTGRAVLDQALAAGHRVTAMVRDAARLPLQHPHLTVLEGDGTDAQRIAEVLPGHDVVISTVGAPPSSRAGVRESCTRAQIEAMQAQKVRRLISLSTHGVGESRNDLPWFMKLFIVPFILRRAFADHEAQEALVRQSDLDWTLVKPTNLTDDPASGDYAHGFVNVPKGRSMKVPRADVAAFIVAQIDSDAYVGKEPGITS
ncbi:MAG: SDR family oxidoreductase [Myxococcota bacterium]